MNNKKIKAILFDLDGVVLSTDHYHFLAWKQMADELAIPFTKTDNERLRGVSRMESLEIVLEKYTGAPLTAEEKVALAEKKNDAYRVYLRQMSPSDVADEVRDTLRELRRRGYRLAIGSSSKNARFILSQTEMTDFFDAIADGTDISRSKPDPEVFVKAAQFVNTDPAECAVVEDAFAGIEAAVGGGMLPVAIGSAVDCPMAVHKLTTFSDLLKLFN
ncbi:MAG: beta-phosphoglucomutase [Clostridia bacterium]|nr:beta-phosphoglucomutase [Clostridia bacterium]